MPYLPGTRLASFLKRLPRTETHLHIEGALPWELLERVDPGRFAAPPESWKDHYKFDSFSHFERELLDMACAWFTSPERYHEAAGMIFERLRDHENVRYVETSFASGMIEFLGLNGAEVAEAIQSAAPEDVLVRVFMGIHHDGYTVRSRGFIDQCLEWPALAGIDLHGTETTPLEDWTGPFWHRAREAGKVTKAHAGEFDGPPFIRRVIDELGVLRIQHGVRSVESPELVRELRERGAVLDVCPISNVKLGVVREMESHPIRQLFDAGVVCTVNTDDPLSFGNTLTEEYTALHQELGFTFAELGELAANGFRAAAGTESRFAAELEEIRNLVDAFAAAES